MIADIHQILRTYWGFSEFRPLQEDIIQSALNNRDTLALLPTGGGKSICFQVPVMAREGIGIVISPLIALMADQVANLRNRDIPAVSLSGGLSSREIDITLENCVNGRYKFLYLSPERLQSDIVQQRLKRMKVNLLIVDEAHCISQWGYDFRPPYTQIREIRKLLPEVAVLALTATATPEVVEDIQSQLDFREKNVLQKSFLRQNLSYNVRHTEKKWSVCLEILRRISGSGIIYVRNRKHTVEIAQWLQKNGISADYYHAGLSSAERDKKQQAWIDNQIRIIVCTNAFGMGIDKPDVRLVIHLELPESLEAYFQEAGRAGRDGKTAYSVMLVGPPDIGELKRKQLEEFPDLTFVRHVYDALHNHLQLATGIGAGLSFPFHFQDFIKKYSIPALKTYQALKIMEREGLLSLNEGFQQLSRLIIKVDRTTLYDFQLRHPRLEPLIKVLSRSYGGLDVEYTPIDEQLLASRLKTKTKYVIQALEHLVQKGIIDYIKREGDSILTLHMARTKSEYLRISDENLKHRYRDRVKRIEAVEDFVEDTTMCRSRKLLRYFGELKSEDCGHCDICRKAKSEMSKDERVAEAIDFIRRLKNTDDHFNMESLKNKSGLPEVYCLEALRWLIDSGEVYMQRPGYYSFTFDF